MVFDRYLDVRLRLDSILLEKSCTKFSNQVCGKSVGLRVSYLPFALQQSKLVSSIAGKLVTLQHCRQLFQSRTRKKEKLSKFKIQDKINNWQVVNLRRSFAKNLRNLVRKVVRCGVVLYLRHITVRMGCSQSEQSTPSGLARISSHNKYIFNTLRIELSNVNFFN